MKDKDMTINNSWEGEKLAKLIYDDLLIFENYGENVSIDRDKLKQFISKVESQARQEERELIVKEGIGIYCPNCSQLLNLNNKSITECGLCDNLFVGKDANEDVLRSMGINKKNLSPGTN